MIIPPNILKIAVTVGIIGLLILAFSYMFEFLRPVLAAIFLIVVAYLLYRYFIVGTLTLW
jgi:hypothetical protein